MFVQSFASGSSGNCYLVCCGDTVLLLDAGISCRGITSSLKLNDILPVDVAAILVTHEHADHVKGIQVFAARSKAKVFASHATWQQISALGIDVASEQRCGFSAGDTWQIGNALVASFSSYHDSVDCIGYVVEDMQSGQRVGLVTDTGTYDQKMVEALRGCHLLIVESNHDPEMLKKGPYPAFLKKRIASNHGHLSNRAGAELIGEILSSVTKSVWLAHLSEENNAPELALGEIMSMLESKKEFHQCPPEVKVVPRAMLGPVFPDKRCCSLF